MKKFVRIISAVLALLMCISAVACGAKGDGDDMNTDKPVDTRAKVGDKIILGKFEQNGDISSKEDISWTVIKVEEGRALLLADKCLSYANFHSAYEEFCWADSDVRIWLNIDFYKAAFTDEEKALILTETIETRENYLFNNGGDDSSKDSVFLLSVDEAKELLTEETVIGVPTDFIKNTATLTHGKSACNWWLRTRGQTAMKAAAVGYNGDINYSGFRGDIAEAGVRPCVWYKTETDADPVILPLTLDEIGAAKVGDKVVVGKYDADANEENGAEDIIWTVAAEENGKKLLVADKVLDAFEYNATLDNNVNWSSCTLKIWLSGAFMRKAFSEAEIARISSVKLGAAAVNGVEVPETYSHVFVLSAEELAKYFPEREDRMVAPTKTAVANGVYADPIYGTCDYWVREAGTTAGNGAYAYYYGDVNEAGALARSTYIGVRPAMWILPA